MGGRVTTGGLTIIGILMICFITLLLNRHSHTLSANASLEETLALAMGEVHRDSIAIGAITPKVRVQLQSTGTVQVTLGNDQQTCVAAECVLIFNPQPAGEQLPLVISAQTDTLITEFEMSLVKYRLNTTLSRFSVDKWLVVLTLMIAALVVNAVFFKHQQLVQWLVCVLTILFLIYNDALFTACLTVYLYAIYSLRNMVNISKNRYLLTSLLMTSIAFLLIFKYAKEVIWGIFANPGGFDLLMPVGISYFIIRLLDTQLRWYRGDSTAITFREFLFFIIFPGTLIAGPIEDIRHFYENRLTRIGSSDYAQGLARILTGIFKKIVIADALLLTILQGTTTITIPGLTQSVSADTLAAMPASAAGEQIFLFALVGLTYAYIDFSAYSDIAIGLSRLFGYRVKENFNFPLLAPNIREYWKRWHMSLSDWSFRNIYFPAAIRSQNSYLPLYLTMLCIGMWHAFTLPWFSWAIHHATGMTLVGIIQKYVQLSANWLTWLRPLRTALTLVYVSLGFIFVYFNDYDIALELYLGYLRWLFSWTGLT